MHITGDIDTPPTAGSRVEFGAFVDGPELEGSPTLPVLGTATYEGVAGGGYAVVYGTDASVPSGTTEVGSFDAQLLLVADFGTRRIGGKVHSIHVDPGADAPFAIIPVPYELNLGASGFDEELFTGSVTMTSLDPEIRITRSGGSWGGKFSNMPDGDGNPRLVAGTVGGEFTTAGGTQAGYIGAFAGATNR